MKKLLLLLVLILLPMVARAYDIAVKNADGVTIYYDFAWDATELAVTSCGNSSSGYKYSGNIVIPDEVTYMNKTYKVTMISRQAFKGCAGLTSITLGNNVLDILEAFSGCTGLTSITIPSSVEYITKGAFEGCSNLTSVTIESNSFLNNGYNTMVNCFGPQVQNYIIGNSVTSIGYYAF